MRLGANVIVLIMSLLIASAVSGRSKRNGRKKGNPDATRPAITVVVANLKVDSDKANVQGKIEELSKKLRDKVSEHAEKFEVVSAKRVRNIKRRYRKAIANCYDDCDVEFGLLAKANFVIGGHLEPSTSGIIGTLEIRNTQNREVVSTKQVSGANYFELESAMLAAVRRFVRPLNNVVFQATDEEVVKDKSAESKEPEDVTGLGSSSDDVATSTGQPESDYIAQTEEEEERSWGKLDEFWADVKDEKPFLKEDDHGFEADNAPGIFGIGINGGYSFNVSRAKHLRKLYTPVFHLGAQLQARLHHLFEFAVVADIDYLNGSSWADNRFGTPNLNEATDDDAPELRSLNRYNNYEHGSYLTVGIRPTARLVIPINLLEAFIGVGMGFNYVKTSGYWHTQASAQEVYLQDLGVPAKDVQEDVVYNFKTSHFGFYGLIEAALIVRAFSDRLGVGALFQYKMPSTWKGGTKTDVTIENLLPTVSEGPAGNGQNAFGTPTADDVRNSPIGHIDPLNLLTLGLIADWRF